MRCYYSAFVLRCYRLSTCPLLSRALLVLAAHACIRHGYSLPLPPYAPVEKASHGNPLSDTVVMNPNGITEGLIVYIDSTRRLEGDWTFRSRCTAGHINLSWIASRCSSNVWRSGLQSEQLPECMAWYIVWRKREMQLKSERDF